MCYLCYFYLVCRGSCVIYVICIYLCIQNVRCPKRFQYQIMFVSFNSNMTGFTCQTGTANPSGAHESTSVVSGIRVARSLVFCV
jgi:hypothetical protein